MLQPWGALSSVLSARTAILRHQTEAGDEHLWSMGAHNILVWWGWWGEALEDPFSLFSIGISLQLSASASFPSNLKTNPACVSSGVLAQFPQFSACLESWKFDKDKAGVPSSKAGRGRAQ